MNCRFVVVLFSALVALPASASESGTDMLIKMNNALHRMNYSGTLVHIKENDINTLRVEHEVVNGVENETITSLNAEKGAVSSQTQSFSSAMVSGTIEQMLKVYSVDVGAMKKVAKRDCQIVVARPKDKMRYLQKYCIDKETSLPLAYSLINNSHKTVERFTFTDVTIAEAEGVETKVSTSVPQEWIPDSLTAGGWSIDSLPKGFRFGKHLVSQQAEVERGPDTEHFVLTDGLSAISVFITPSATAKPKSASSMTSGALNVLTSYKNSHRITLVGEVPRATMQNVLSNLKYQGKP